MTKEQSAAYINSEATAAMIRAMGMQAENQHRLSLGQSIAYREDAFEKLSTEFQIGHNAAIGMFIEATNS